MTLTLRQTAERDLETLFKKLDEIDELVKELGGMRELKKLSDSNLFNLTQERDYWQKQFTDMQSHSIQETTKFWAAVDHLAYAVGILRDYDPERAEELARRRAQLFKEDAN